MKKLLLTSILGLFLLGGLSITVSATEVPEKEKEKKAACCKAGHDGEQAVAAETPEGKAKCADRTDKKTCCKDKDKKDAAGCKDKKDAAGCKDKKPACEDKKAKPETPPAN